MTEQGKVWTTTRDKPGVDVETLARQMAAVSRAALLSYQQQLGACPTRASVMNLIVRAPDQAVARQAAETVRQLASLYPCRSLVITSQADAAEPSVDASVSAFSHLNSDARELVCLEQVELLARGDTSRHLSSIVVSLLLPDLPVFLWWIGAPPEAEESLLWVCDRLVVDSAAFQEPLPQLAKLAALVSVQESRPRAVALSDFTWARVTPWRELIAQFFDGRDSLPYLYRLNSIRIEYATDPGGTAHAAPALLLIGWLAAKLGWQPGAVLTRAHARDYRLDFSRHGKPVSVQVVPRARAGEVGATGEILSVQLLAGGDKLEASFEITQTFDGHAIAHTHFPGLREMTRTVPMERPLVGDLLRAELAILTYDHIFEESLAVIARTLP